MPAIIKMEKKVTKITELIRNEFKENRISTTRILKPNDNNWPEVYQQVRIEHTTEYPDTQKCIEIKDNEGYYSGNAD